MNKKVDSPTLPSRRRVLSLVGAGALAASGLLGHTSARAALSYLPREILSVISTLEALAVTFYHTALAQANFHIDGAASHQLVQMLVTEKAHLKRLQSLGATVQESTFSLPAQMLEDASVFVQAAQQLEALSMDAYLTATRELATLGESTLALETARLAVVEGQHHSVLAHLAGLSGLEHPQSTLEVRRMAEVSKAIAAFQARGPGALEPIAWTSLV